MPFDFDPAKLGMGGGGGGGPPPNIGIGAAGGCLLCEKTLLFEVKLDKSNRNSPVEVLGQTSHCQNRAEEEQLVVDYLPAALVEALAVKLVEIIRI